MKTTSILAHSLLLSGAHGTWIWSVRQGLKGLEKNDGNPTLRKGKSGTSPQDATYSEIDQSESLKKTGTPGLIQTGEEAASTQYAPESLQGTRNALDQILFKYPTQFLVEPELEDVLPIAPGSSVVKMHYGPIIVQAKSSEAQMLIPEFPKPCDSCFITAMQGDVMLADGMRAYVADGISLHQMTLYNTNKRDLICPGEIYPVPQRIYATGDEREVVRVNNGNSDWGIEIRQTDRLSMVYHIENNSNKDVEVNLTMIYEIVETPPSQNFRNVEMVWLDVMGCNDISFPGNNGSFAVESPRWTSTIQGQLLFSSGHISNGGYELTVYINGVPACVQNVLYGRKLGYVENATNISHLSDISICRGFGQIKVGDEISLVAKYDTKRYQLTPGLHGEIRPMRGSARVYIGM